jgi:hypothetical protein
MDVNSRATAHVAAERGRVYTKGFTFSAARGISDRFWSKNIFDSFDSVPFDESPRLLVSWS